MLDLTTAGVLDFFVLFRLHGLVVTIYQWSVVVAEYKIVIAVSELMKDYGRLVGVIYKHSDVIDLEAVFPTLGKPP